MTRDLRTRIGGRIEMFVLGIETSCDETSFSIVEDGARLLSYTIASSADIHAKYGGVIPEIASRRHLKVLSPLLTELFRQGSPKLEDIDLIAVTNRPGLVPSLLVGVAAAKAFALGMNKPLVGVDHIIAHLYAPFIDNPHPPEFPFVGLVVSGGHTQIFLVRGWHPDEIKVLGKTKDDAAGEALDKAAKLLGLGYPGGPIIERRARQGSIRYKFSCYRGNDFDFSFSGLKTSLLYFVKNKDLSDEFINDICASFQHIVMDVLVDKTLRAARQYLVKDIVIGGGVSANQYLRKLFDERKGNLQVHFPPMKFCIDNAAMIAGLGYQWYVRGIRDSMNLEVESRSY